MDFDDLHLWIGGAMIAIALLMSSCAASLRCTEPVTVRGEGSHVGIYCRGAQLWREPCPAAVVRNSRLYCGGSVAVRLPEEVTRGE